MSLVFRQGGEGDAGAFARLASHSFPGLGNTLPEWETWLRDAPLGGVDTLWIGEEAGRPVAACQLLRLEQWISGVRIPIMGLAAVTISATSRRRGLAAELVASGLRHARDRGDLATALFPFRTSFYRRLGYGMAGDVMQYRVPPRALPDDPGRANVILAESAEERAAIATIYDRWAPGQSGQLVRGPRSWEPVWAGNTRYGALYRDAAGEPSGYLVFHYLTEGPPSARGVIVDEIAWLSRDARLGLYGWLASLQDQWEQIIYCAHPDEAFPEHLTELRFPAPEVPRWHFWFPGATALSGPMFRLLDVPAAWTVRRVQPHTALSLALEVHDDHLDTNGGTWTIRLEGGRVEVVAGASGAIDIRMQVGIEALSRLYIGALTPSAAVLAGLATVDRADLVQRLDSLLHVPRPWMFDRF